MTNVCVAGVTGWTAAPIAQAIEASDDLTLVSGVSRSRAGERLADVVDVSSTGPVHADVRTALEAGDVDVLVDYTHAAVVREHVLAGVRAGVHVVIGSSGLGDDDFAEIDALAREHAVGVFASGNFSVLAASLQAAAKLVARHTERWEIVDIAGDTKPDVPSGTSRELAEVLADVRRQELAVAVEDLHGPQEARGAQVAGTPVHSVRLPGYVVSTEITFASEHGRLVMHYDSSSSPDAYVDGTLLAIRRVADQPGVRRGLDTLLFD